MPDSNPVGTLQEHAQSRGGTFPLYRLLQHVGDSHCQNFNIEVRFGEYSAEGMAANKQLAKHEAAKNILALIRGQNESDDKVQANPYKIGIRGFLLLVIFEKGLLLDFTQITH